MEDMAVVILGRQWLQLDSIAVGLGAVRLKLSDLQAVIAGQDNPQQRQNDRNSGHCSRTVYPGLPVRILQGDVLWHVTAWPGCDLRNDYSR